MAKITSPKEFFGFTPGDDYEMARWDKIVEYFYLLEKESDRISVEDMGPSTEGNPFLKVIITSPENFKNLDEIKADNAKIYDPRGLSQEEIDALVAKGKAVCVQSMSMHAREIGGSQMAPNLAYHLLIQEDEEIDLILNNVIFVMVPCFNPDGEIMLTDWYYKTKGTESEGSDYPKLYHKYTGHDNNRDAMYQNIVESKYVCDILFHEWMPQAYQDHHHQGSYGARILITPYRNPVRPYVEPLVWRELNMYGAAMAYYGESQGLDGISSGSNYPGWGHYGFHWIANSHNIAGMLTEAASAKLASPKFIPYEQLQGDKDLFQPEYEAQTNFPSPWQGGWWHLSGVTEREEAVSYALLLEMARKRKEILKNMTVKALNQTKKGEESEEYAYIISADSHDKSAFVHMINVLQGQGVKVSIAKEAFTASCRTYPAGSAVVFLAQPKFGLIMNLMGRTLYPDKHWTHAQDGSVKAYDTATDTIGEYMGLEVVPAGEKFTGSFEELDTEVPYVIPAAKVEKAAAYALDGRNNHSFKVVNALLKKGIKVFRLNDCPWHSFYTECDAATIGELCEKFSVSAKAVEKTDKVTPWTASKIGMYQRYYCGNADEGWTRLMFEQYGFDYDTLMDKDVTVENLKKYDVVIIPSEAMEAYLFGEGCLTDLQKAEALGRIGVQPVEYRSGLGKAGYAAIRAYVEEGGRVLAFNQSCPWVSKMVGLPVRDMAAGKSKLEYNTIGSTMRVTFDNTHPLAWGMPKKGFILQTNSPILKLAEQNFAELCPTVVKYVDRDVLQSGFLCGEKLLAGQPAMLQVKHGKGDVVLYAFGVQHRYQTDGTFKLLFNALYKM